MFAVRPEAFQLAEAEHSFPIRCVVKDIAVLGSIVRYTLESNSVTFSADLLQQRGAGLVLHDEMTLYLPKEDVIPLT